jgi:lysine biosynthesis protein LysW
MGACPECDADVIFSESPVLDQTIQCPHCYAELLVIGLTPIELDWAFEEPLIDKPLVHEQKRDGGNGKSAG